MKSIAIIPARAGSKSIINKNICLLNDKPLIAYSIEVAIASNVFDKVIVSTDSKKICDIAKSYGAEVPFLRPKALATDTACDREYIEHALDWYLINCDYIPDMVSILRPTTPLRSAKVIKSAIEKFIKYYSQSTSLRAVHELAEPPQKMLKLEGEWLTGFFPGDKRKEYFNLPRQSFPKAYCPNGYIDIVKTEHIRTSSQGIFGCKILSFITEFAVEVDLPRDLDYLEFLLKSKAICHHMN